MGNGILVKSESKGDEQKRWSGERLVGKERRR